MLEMEDLENTLVKYYINYTVKICPAGRVYASYPVPRVNATGHKSKARAVEEASVPSSSIPFHHRCHLLVELELGILEHSRSGRAH